MNIQTIRVALVAPILFLLAMPAMPTHANVLSPGYLPTVTIEVDSTPVTSEYLILKEHRYLNKKGNERVEYSVGPCTDTGVCEKVTLHTEKHPERYTIYLIQMNEAFGEKMRHAISAGDAYKTMLNIYERQAENEVARYDITSTARELDGGWNERIIDYTVNVNSADGTTTVSTADRGKFNARVAYNNPYYPEHKLRETIQYYIGLFTHLSLWITISIIVVFMAVTSTTIILLRRLYLRLQKKH